MESEKDWTDLVCDGWEKEETILNNKKQVIFKTPMANGVRRIIRRSRDLKGDEKKLAGILFPQSLLGKRHASNSREEKNTTRENLPIAGPSPSSTRSSDKIEMKKKR